MPSKLHCCCDCPTKSETGLPDVITLTITKLTSSSSGMPSDEALGGECNPYRRWTFSDAIIDLLTSLTFDYIGSAPSTSCASCCFHYKGRGSYTPDCPADAASDFILLGATPFESHAYGDSVNIKRWDGDQVTDIVAPDPASCCPEPYNLECKDICGFTIDTNNGTIILPQALYAAADLYICVNGSVVTICIPITVTVPCREIVSTGSCSYISEQGFEIYPDCTDKGEFQDCSPGPTEDCLTVDVDITLTATLDLSGVSGSTIWDKIQAASTSPTWESDYEYAACSCAGSGCTGDYIETLCGCGIAYTCVCFDMENAYGDCTPTDYGATEIDEQCIYSVGTVNLEFS